MTDEGREDLEYWTVKYDYDDIVFEWDEDDVSDNNGNDENIVLDEELDDESLKGSNCE